MNNRAFERAEVQAALEEAGIRFDTAGRLAILDEIMKDGPLLEADLLHLVSAARAPIDLSQSQVQVARQAGPDEQPGQ